MPTKQSWKGAFAELSEETHQGHRTRRDLYSRIEAELGDDARVIAFCTSFHHPVIIANDDSDMLEEVLRNSDMKGRCLYLIVNSPGGDGIAAERIVKVCRTYSKNGAFRVLVPKRAKSAATMICLGAEAIYMGPTSELGPIDPQFPVFNEAGVFNGFQAAHEIVSSYQELLEEAVATEGNVEPYLRLLCRYDTREIRRMLQAQALSVSIAVRLLKTGVMSKRSIASIKKSIERFTDPRFTKDHARPIYREEAARCGLAIESCDESGALWNALWPLYVRLSNYAERYVSKVIESATVSCSVSIPEYNGQ